MAQMKLLSFAFALAFVMSAGQDPANGSIAGTLRTRDGEPVAGVRVAAVAVSDSPAQSKEPATLVSISQSASDGSYKLENIPPGRYYITAGLLNALTYYPSGDDPSHAVVVNVTAKSVLSGYDFIPGAFPVPIRGRVVLTGVPGAAMPKELTLTGAEPRRVRIDADGSFQLERLLPGAYTLSTTPEFFGSAGNIVLYQFKFVNEITGNSVTIDSQVHQDLVVNLDASPLSVKQMKVDGKIINIAPEASPLVGRRILFSSSIPGLPTIETRINADNTFEYPKVLPGIYKVDIEGLPLLRSTQSITILDEGATVNIDVHNHPYLEYPGSMAPVFGGPSSATTISLRGVVTEPPQPINNAAQIYYFRMAVKDEATKQTLQWAVIWSIFSPDPLKIGDVIVVTGYVARDGTHRLYLLSINGR